MQFKFTGQTSIKELFALAKEAQGNNPGGCFRDITLNCYSNETRKKIIEVRKNFNAYFNGEGSSKDDPQQPCSIKPDSSIVVSYNAWTFTCYVNMGGKKFIIHEDSEHDSDYPIIAHDGSSIYTLSADYEYYFDYGDGDFDSEIEPISINRMRGLIF